MDVTVTTFAGTSAATPVDQFIYTSTMTVTPANWTSAGLTFVLGNDANLHAYATGTTTDAVAPYPWASVANIVITSPSVPGFNLTITSTGNPIPTGGLTYSGAGGLIITGSGIVALSGTEAYTGGTTVTAGTLVVKNAGAYPAGTSLSVSGGRDLHFRSLAGAGPMNRTVAMPYGHARRHNRRYEPGGFRAECREPGFVEQPAARPASASPWVPCSRGRSVEQFALTPCPPPQGRGEAMRTWPGSGRLQTVRIVRIGSV